MTPQPKIYIAGHRGMVGSAIVRQLQAMDCHVAGAPRNDGKGAVIASEARQSMPAANPPRHDECRETILPPPSPMTPQKTALITGITGQDGSYLAEFLLEKGYVVHGIKRRASSFNTQRVDHRGVNEVGYWTNRPDSSLRAQRGNPGSIDRHGLQPRDDEEVPIVKIDPRYFRPTEVASLLGDPTKAKQKLGWVPKITAQEMCAEIVANDLADAKKHALLKHHGYKVNVLVNINPGDYTMQSEHFDLNDIQHEPTDAQLKALMNSVALEAKRRAELARSALMQRLRDDIVAANRSRSVA